MAEGRTCKTERGEGGRLNLREKENGPSPKVRQEKGVPSPVEPNANLWWII